LKKKEKGRRILRNTQNELKKLIMGRKEKMN